MIPFYLILTSMGLLTVGNDPKHPHTATTRRFSSQSVYSAHNYKQPHSVARTYMESRPGIAVSQSTTPPTNYKHQQIVVQPTGSVTTNYVPVVTSFERNYKSRQPIKSTKSVDKTQQPAVVN